MKIGTRSILFGIHAFWFHPVTVARAWRACYGGRPNWWQLIAIFCHDLAYWGKPNIDGPEGKQHPFGGARIAARIVGLLRGSLKPDGRTYRFTLLHSRDMARQFNTPASPLCWADKVSIFFDPPWFYLLRGKLSGEIAEFKQHAIAGGHIPPTATDREWLRFYRRHILNSPIVRRLVGESFYEENKTNL